MPTVIDESTRRRVIEEVARHGNKSKAARECGVHRDTVIKICQAGGCQESVEKVPMPARLPEPAAEAGGAALPEPIETKWDTLTIDGPSQVGILTDAHIPYHDKRTIELWVRECKQRNVSHILLNGDILDCGEVSSHYRTPNETRLEEELEAGQQFLAYLRGQFPRTRIIYRSGNHEDRLPRYVANNAPALFNIKALTLPALLGMDTLGIEWVQDKRLIMLGKLATLHGHEYQGGGGVMPSRWLYLRTGDSCLIGHFHRSDNYTFRTVTDREVGVWSVGCSCFLKPLYAPFNQWRNGYAICEVANNGHYAVTNRQVLKDGMVC